MVVHVGSSIPVIRGNKKKERKISYKEVTYDNEGWADVNEYLPIKFDLCKVKTGDGEVKPAWYTGNGWDGQRMFENDKVQYWSREDYENPNFFLNR